MEKHEVKVVETHKSKTHHVRVVSPTQKAFNLWGIIVIIWAFYRSTIGANSPITFDEFIFKPVVFLWPVLYYVTSIEHKNLEAGLWIAKRNWKSNVKFALLVAAPVFTFGLFVSFANVGVQFNLNKTILYMLIALAISITEETLSRGFVARHIWDETHGLFKTVFQASLLHMFLRIPRIMTMPELFGQKLIVFFVAELLLSFVLTTIFLYRKSLIPVYILRFAATFTLLMLMA
ncbi:MAG: hypothetical protein U0525_00290 [Patescibacteria group bacterium]